MSSEDKIEIVIDKMEIMSIVKQPRPLEIPLYYILPVYVNSDDDICKDFDLIRSNLITNNLITNREKKIKKIEIKSENICDMV